MSERGYADITLTLVAERAGVARNTVYGYYPDKEALLLAYLDREVAGVMDRATSAIQTVRSAADRLRVLIELQTEYFASTAAAGQDLAGVLNPQSFGQISAAFTPLLRLFTQIIQDGRDDGEFREVDVHSTARLVFGLLGTYRVALAEGTVTATQVSDTMLDLLLHGIARQPAAPSTNN
ncbi:MAG: TetR/AcrR family transcriptional regulator [Thermomicrobiales bacterium]|nr:TetR/AcrR family transcriptional regulator [Thermomicrobiales bacterium]